MDLDSDFISVQGIFLSLQSSIGDFKQIKHAGGNEKSILRIITELHKFLSSKNYIKNQRINRAFDGKLDNIVIFLILNTEMDSDLEQEDLTHLSNVMPKISKFLLANLIVGLDLTPHYCKALEGFSLQPTEELLVEMPDCIKKSNPTLHLQNAAQILHLIIFKLNQETKKHQDAVEKLISLSTAILLNLTGIAAEQKPSVRINEIYIHMGNTISNIFDLLLKCDINNSIMYDLIEKLIHTCYGLMMSVTLDVFCAWAEIEDDTESLQSLITSKAYWTMEKYQKFQPAKELIVMLGNIARKPKSINDLILHASEDTIISMINRADSNQKQWFRAIMNTQTLKSENAINCVNKWVNLCNKEDVLCLLSQSKVTRDEKAINLVIKSSSVLELDDLSLVLIRHFYKNGINYNLSENIHSQLTILLNKLKDKQVDEEMSKDLHLLLLQNPEQFLRSIFTECLKNTFYTENLQDFLVSLEQVFLVDNIGTRLLIEEINKHIPDEHNSKNYTHFFNMLIGKEIYPAEVVVLTLILPLLNKLQKDSNYSGIKNTLEILNNLNALMELKPETEEFFGALFLLMDSFRCKFLEFNRLKHEITRECVEILEKHCKSYENISYSPEIEIQSEDVFTMYYIQKLFQRTESLPTFLQYLFPTLQFNNQSEVVAHLIKILPLCVMHEWIELGSNLMIIYGMLRTMESFSNCLVLLSQVINSQATQTEEVKCMLNGLKCCLQSYGNLTKMIFQKNVKYQEEDIALTQNICRVIQQIPQGLKSEEGLSLVSLLSDDSLKSLRGDRKFACLVASINDSHICQVLAEKILN